MTRARKEPCPHWVEAPPEGGSAAREALPARGARERRRHRRSAPRHVHVVERLRADGIEPFVPRRRDYDLTRREDTERLFADARPDLVLHLAAEVGGIGANRDNPGRYWYANLMMGAHVLEPRASTRSTRSILGTICAYPKFAARAVPRGRSLERLPGGRTRRTASRKKVAVGAQGISGVVRAEVRLPPARQPLWSPGQLRPRELARDPGADPQDGRGAGAGRPRGLPLGDGLADARVPLRRRLRRGDRAGRAALRRPRAGQPRHGRSRSASWRSWWQSSRASTGSSAGTRRSRTASPAASSTSRAEELFGFRARTTLRDGSSARSPGIASMRRTWPRQPAGRQLRGVSGGCVGMTAASSSAELLREQHALVESREMTVE